MEKKNKNLKNNLAGIIPISGREDKLGLVLPDCCQPLGYDYMAIERSVLECAYAGCNTIWIVCNDNTAPIIKKKIGDYIIDPSCYESRHYVRFLKENLKYIPVFYTPVHPKDRDKRDSLGWSAMYGALVSYSVSHKISSWVAPKKYFISFPYGIYDPYLARKHKKEINSQKENFYFSYNNFTVRDNKYLGFTLFPEEWKKNRDFTRNQCTGADKSIPFRERWSSKNFTLDKIFNNDIILIDKKVEVESYYSLDSWDSLREYYSGAPLKKDEKSQIIGGFKHKGMFDEE